MAVFWLQLTGEEDMSTLLIVLLVLLVLGGGGWGYSRWRV
jgi:LPXTG-motif cell wall-anchored protein